MPTNDENEREQQSQIDPEVREIIQDEARSAAGRGPNVRKEEQKKKAIASAMLRAITAKDERSFSALLRRAGVKQGSREWKNAWNVFRSA